MSYKNVHFTNDNSPPYDLEVKECRVVADKEEVSTDNQSQE